MKAKEAKQILDETTDLEWGIIENTEPKKELTAVNLKVVIDKDGTNGYFFYAEDHRDNTLDTGLVSGNIRNEFEEFAESVQSELVVTI